MFRIGEFSKICRVPVSALRYYADLGLLEPAHIDQFTAYRYYSLDQLPRLNRILALKDLGLALEQIAQILHEDLPAEQIRGMLRLKQAEIRQRLDEEQARLDRVEARLKQIEKEGKMPEHDVVLKQIEAQLTLSIREVIPTPDHVGHLLGESYTAMIANGLDGAAPPYTIYHDEEFKPADMDIEIAIPVAASVKTSVALNGGRTLALRQQPALSSAAGVIHRGSYDTLEASYSAIGRWIEENGYRIVGPPREVYLTAPDSPEGPITEIQYPVEKR